VVRRVWICSTVTRRTTPSTNGSARPAPQAGAQVQVTSQVTVTVRGQTPSGAWRLVRWYRWPQVASGAVVPDQGRPGPGQARGGLSSPGRQVSETGVAVAVTAAAGMAARAVTGVQAAGSTHTQVSSPVMRG
jgi:hypothetical protein